METHSEPGVDVHQVATGDGLDNAVIVVHDLSELRVTAAVVAAEHQPAHHVSDRPENSSRWVQTHTLTHTLTHMDTDTHTLP